MNIFSKLNIFKGVNRLEKEIGELNTKIDILEEDIMDNLVNIVKLFSEHLEREKIVLINKEHRLTKIGKVIQYSNLNREVDLDVD